MKLAFADTYRHSFAERASMEVTTEQAASTRPTLAARAKLIDMKRAQDFGAGTPVKGGTIYLSAADESGMMVSFIQSNYMGFGSGVVVPGVRACRCENRGHAASAPRRRGEPTTPRRARASDRSTPSSRRSSPRAAGDDARRSPDELSA